MFSGVDLSLSSNSPDRTVRTGRSRRSDARLHGVAPMPHASCAVSAAAVRASGATKLATGSSAATSARAATAFTAAVAAPAAVVDPLGPATFATACAVGTARLAATAGRQGHARRLDPTRASSARG